MVSSLRKVRAGCFTVSASDTCAAVDPSRDGPRKSAESPGRFSELARAVLRDGVSSDDAPVSVEDEVSYGAPAA